MRDGGKEIVITKFKIELNIKKFYLSIIENHEKKT
jgi:hypothetical protein